MGVPRGTRRVWVIGLGLLAAGLLVVTMVSIEGALGIDVRVPVGTVAGALVVTVAAGRVVSRGAAAPRGLRVIAWGVPVLLTLLALFALGLSAPLASGLEPLAVFLLVAMLWSPVLILWIVFGITVVVSRPPRTSRVRRRDPRVEE